jgi:succinyl-diaminopimelate desuccinylase
MTPSDSILDLARRLVQVPSRGAIDPAAPIVEVVAEWLAAHGIPVLLLHDSEHTLVGLRASAVNSRSGPAYVLNAPLDTATFGDETTWTVSPTSGEVRDGWLYGRGSADSKSGIAIFCHVAARLAEQAPYLEGSVDLVFDLDEHTGGFGGARAYFDQLQLSVRRPEGVYIGYPGNDRIELGSRGFLRATLTVWGQAAHSGATRNRGVNAIARAAELVRELSLMELDASTTPEFPLRPVLTVTQMEGGGSFSQVPDRCRVGIDIRLTPTFTIGEARARVEALVMAKNIDGHETRIDWHPGWPPYRVPDDHQMVRVLQEEAQRVFSRAIPTSVSGPSNIGNYLAQLGIPALCGFGVTAAGVHAADERAEIATMEPVAEVYFQTLVRLLKR